MGLTLLFVSFSVTADTKVHPAGNSAQSAFLGQVLTHSMHKIHSVPFFRFLELSVISTFIGPLLFGRGWCGYACWTAMVLDFLPYKKPQAARKKIGFRKIVTGQIYLQNALLSLNRNARIIPTI